MNANEVCHWLIMRKCLLAMLMLVILMLILMLLNLNTGYADTDADLCIRIMSLWCTNTFDPVTLNLEFDLFLKTLPLFITFEKWVLEFWYFPWVFLVSRPFLEYQQFLPGDLDLKLCHTFLITLSSLKTFEQCKLKYCYFT